MAKFITIPVLIQVNEPDEQADLFKELNIKTSSTTEDNVKRVSARINIDDISHILPVGDNRAIVMLKSKLPNLISDAYDQINIELKHFIIL